MGVDMAGQKPTNAAEEREHRRILRDLRQQGQAALTWGLPNPATESAIIGMGLVIRDKLQDSSDPSRASAAARLASTLLDRTTAKMAQASDFACARGCSHCCYSAVPVSAPEVLALANHIASAQGKASGLDPASVLSRTNARVALQNSKAGNGGPLPCPLLVDDACSVHDARPMSCRQTFSTSAEACRDVKEGRRNDVPFVPAGINAGVMLRALLISASHSSGLDFGTYELSSALSIALETPDAERRWLAGEDVFAGAVKLQRPPQMQDSIDRWSGMLTELTR
jgi:Fe-S-cluster containining protein